MARILHITKYYYPFIGGVEQVTRDCVLSLTNYEQKIICFNHEKGNKIDYIDNVEVNRVSCQVKVSSQSISLGYKKVINKIFKEYKPDIVIFHYPNPFVGHFLLKHLKNKNFKFILYWHLDITKQKFLRIFFEKQNKKLLDRADVIISTSPIYRDASKYLSLYKDKVKVVPCCINEARLNTSLMHVEMAKKLKDDNKTIIFALGRHVPYKGLKYLVLASRYLDDSFKIYIGGSGPLTNELKELAKNDSKICFLGKINDDELKSYLLAMDIFAFPSITKNEAFGIALAEAMYFSHPAVTFTIPGSGVNYVNLNNVTGLEVENSNSEKFAKALIYLRDNPNLLEEYGKKAKDRVLNNFMFSQFDITINKIIEELL